MSDESQLRTGPRRVTDGPWEAHYVIGGEPGIPQFAVVVEHETPDGTSVASIPLTKWRARALVRLLTDMLIEAGEAVAEPTRKPPPLHPRRISLKSGH